MRVGVGIMADVGEGLLVGGIVGSSGAVGNGPRWAQPASETRQTIPTRNRENALRVGSVGRAGHRDETIRWLREED